MSRYQTASKVTTHRSIIAMIKAKSKNPIPEAVTKIVNNETEESTKFMCERCNKLKNPKLKVASTRQFCSCSNSYRIMHSPFIGALVNKKLALNDTFVSRKNSRAKSINFNAVSEKTLNATVINLTNQHRFKASSAHESVRSQNLPCQDIKNEILDNEYRYLVFKGNNSSLIEEVLALRSEWTSENKAKKNIQFI